MEKCIFQYLAMACGMIRGALANIGVNSVVTAEVSAMPACMYWFYQVEVVQFLKVFFVESRKN